MVWGVGAFFGAYGQCDRGKERGGLEDGAAPPHWR